MRQHSVERVRNELVASIVDVLQDSTTARQPASQEVWCRMLGDELGAPVEPQGEAPLRAWLLGVVLACADKEDGLPCLARSLDYVEQQSTAVAELWPLVDEWRAVRFFNDADLRSLRPVLLSPRSWHLSAMARRASRSRVQELPPWCQTAWQVFLRLACEDSQDDELPSGMAFLALCSDRLVEDGRVEGAQLLRRFNRHQAARLGVEDLLAQWRHREFTQPEPPDAPAYLVIQFEPDRLDADRYYVSHWRQADSVGWHPVRGETVLRSREELPGAVEELIEQTEVRWADLSQPVVLEFILPWELLNEPIEWWSRDSDASPSPLIMDYPVVVRSLERLRRASWHRPWHNKWRQLREHPGDTRSLWSRPGDASSFFHLERELKEDAHAVCLVLSEPPSDPSGVGRRELLAGLRAGVPAMIWHRSDCSDPQFQDAVADMVQDHSLGRLTERVGKWRKEALDLGPEGWDQHVGRHLAILFDDPDRRPGPFGELEAWQPAVSAARPSGLRQPRLDVAGAERQQAPSEDAAEICRVHIALLDEPPVASDGSRLLLRVVPGPAHPWSDTETARRPLLAITATPLTPATVEPATALLRPSEQEEDGGEFTFVARHPGRHVLRFTVSLERTGTVLQQVETEIDVLAGDFPSDSATRHTVSQRGGSGR